MSAYSAVNKARRYEVMSREQVVDLIRSGQGDKSLRSYALEIGVTVAYLSGVNHNLREPGPKILKHFGITKTRRVIVEYAKELR